MIDHLSNHPCIVVWVPFNEGWGQHDTNQILKQVKEWDLVGWSTDQADGLIADLVT